MYAYVSVTEETNKKWKADLIPDRLHTSVAFVGNNALRYCTVQLTTDRHRRAASVR